LLLGFLFPLSVDVGLKGVVLSYLAAFFTPYAFIAGGLTLRYGDAFESMIGPLESEQRRRKVTLFMSHCAVPGIGLVGLLYYVLARHGYSLF
jgi:hypothetical protein